MDVFGAHIKPSDRAFGRTKLPAFLPRVCTQIQYKLTPLARPTYKLYNPLAHNKLNELPNPAT